MNANKTPYLRRTEARENRSSAKRDKYGGQGRDNSLLRPDDGHLQLVDNKIFDLALI